MSASGATTASAGQPPPPNALRLIPADGPQDLASHLSRYGPPPLREAGRVIGAVEQAGLTGRGGGAFPTGRKMRAVAQAGKRGAARGTVMLANASESEPASQKDAVLLSTAPHLVLDGVALAAAAVGATRAYVCVGEGGRSAMPALSAAVTQRDRTGLNRVPIQVTATPPGYLAGQETALISALNGGQPLPTLVPPLPAQRGAQRRPTLVLNVETLAHIALIARYGAAWFRELGTPASPGSALITISGAVGRPGVYEIPLGASLADVLQHAGLADPPQAVLTGGYFGAWLQMPTALRLCEESLRPAGAALGPGVLAVLPQSRCGLAETARIIGYLAGQTARQCGPCTNGMPALAEAMKWIAFGQPRADMVGWAHQLTSLITGRGACHLPDGAATLAASALKVFDADLRAHLAGGPCQRAGQPPMLPLPKVDAR